MAVVEHCSTCPLCIPVHSAFASTSQLKHLMKWSQPFAMHLQHVWYTPASRTMHYILDECLWLSFTLSLTHSRVHTHSLTLSHSLAHSHALILACSLTHSLTPSLSPHTHTLTNSGGNGSSIWLHNSSTAPGNVRVSLTL